MSHKLEQLIAALFVVIAVISQALLLGRAAIGINIGLIVAYLIWRAADYHSRKHSRVLLFSILAVIVQATHFFEECLTEFYLSFPAFFGYRWSATLFIGFNLIWLGLFILATWGIHRQVRLAT